MNKLPEEKRLRILGCLVEGMSVRGAARAIGVSKGTVLRLVAEIGPACESFHYRFTRNVACKRLELDEIWEFVGGRDKRLSPKRRKQEGQGSCWTWTALDPASRLMLSYEVGARDVSTCTLFMEDIASRITGPVQISTDAWGVYPPTIAAVFQEQAISYGIVEKTFLSSGNDKSPEHRYSPGKIRSIRTRIVTGDPDEAHICTSHAEKWNQTLRMSAKRYARLTNAHSKDIDYHRWALAMHIWHYNYARVNSAVKMTPAQAAKITTQRFALKDMLNVGMWVRARDVLRLSA